MNNTPEKSSEEKLVEEKFTDQYLMGRRGYNNLLREDIVQALKQTKADTIQEVRDWAEENVEYAKNAREFMERSKHNELLTKLEVFLTSIEK